MAILITGGAGYIGSHAAVEFLKANYDIVVLDNFSNSHVEAIERVKELAGRNFPFYNIDLVDKEAVDQLFAKYDFDSVVHFAGLKAVGESISMPLKYYENNVTGTIRLCEVMAKHQVKKLVFSSSATVYGMPDRVPIDESFPLSATNPYGRSKLMIEEILCDLHVSDPEWSIALLRYFNPIGAHESGRIGENPSGIPNNLMPYITQVAIGKRDKLSVFGSDYETHDGTGVRDYIHVVDLVKGHLKALEYLQGRSGVEAFNLGTGNGYSVLDLVYAFASVSGRKIPYELVERRPGDVAVSYADSVKAAKVLVWKAEKSLKDMCADSWKWQRQNPNGYDQTIINS
ncbi:MULTISPECIES: UDP-glucose 4-epimerase GalE [unclassified Bacillus (in: firmicutes)]|uniref:UDP-glucose 4-epimerase GalE n=1 Tax=unclassified Bacillus (in: firmicutes) TaxID=185979 RepID=UPI00111EF4A4|nr:MULTISPECIES: UDP-glucose 4-epimerase GalE [unclassified Bacillus (in: firmicutes)]